MKWNYRSSNHGAGKGSASRQELQTTADSKLDDITIERISNLDDFLSTTRENLDLIILVREALRCIENILCEMRSLSERAASDNLTSTERAALQKKINKHIAEIDRIAAFTEYKANEIINQDDDHDRNKLH